MATVRAYLVYRQLAEVGITHSQQHLRRLERAAKFPLRFYLNPKLAAWPAHEIKAWLENRTHPQGAA